ncbi:AMP-binding protein [Rhodoblastus sp.]|uniref:AMP-binding protein n=1 Tax=Rhodoblastus sp. TaxID=1962975 RepID=UPI003F9D2195
MSLVSAFLARAAEHPERVAIIEASGASVTYGGLAAMVDGYAKSFRRRGIVAGGRVLVTLPVTIPLYASLAALWSIGATVVFPEPAMGLSGLRHAADVARPSAWLAPSLWRTVGFLFPEIRRIPFTLSPCAASGATAFQEPPDDCDNAAALISFTSGSTDKPKGIVRSHAFLMEQALCLEPLLRPLPGEIDLVAFPVFVLASLGLGSTSVLPNWNIRKPLEADAGSILHYVEERRATRLLIPPAICERLAGKQFPSSVRAVLTGGGPVYPDLLRRLAARTPEVYAVYGSTEAEPIAHVAASEIGSTDWEAMDSGKGILAGYPAARTRVRIVDDEIRVAGPHVNEGYLDPAQNASTKEIDEDGVIWHRTGDAGRIDIEGRLWLLGRIDGRVGDLFPFGVEAAARLWPGVRQVALCSGRDGAPILALTGITSHQHEWRKHALGLGIEKVAVLNEMPLDRRHGSKIDYAKLRLRIYDAIRA